MKIPLFKAWMFWFPVFTEDPKEAELWQALKDGAAHIHHNPTRRVPEQSGVSQAGVNQLVHPEIFGVGEHKPLIPLPADKQPSSLSRVFDEMQDDPQFRASELPELPPESAH